MDHAWLGGPIVRILGTHGVPASYGGFETAAENVALYLRDQGWRVIVYCQAVGDGPIVNDRWRGIERVTIPVRRTGWLGTSEFDFRSIKHASRHRYVCLTFGYNTAVFNLAQRVLGIPNVINMDGMEWTRARWGFLRQMILLANERIARRVGTTLIADHPEIERYLARTVPAERLAMITYGAASVSGAPTDVLDELGLVPGEYMTLICRPIPENNVLELVEAFSRRPRGVTLAVFGELRPDEDEYHRSVIAAAGNEVSFVGPLYDADGLAAVRYHCLAYLHGHTVGGTNPSLVEAMGAGNAVISHDNVYNRWVAEDSALYFADADSAAAAIETLLDDRALVAELGDRARRRHAAEFTWEHVAGEYERVLLPLTGGGR